MKKNFKLFFSVIIVISIFLTYFGVKLYNSDDMKFNRYFNKITSIKRSDVKAIDVGLSKDNLQLKFYSDEEKAYLVLDLLHELSQLKQELSIGNELDYSYGIWNAIQTNESMYAIQLEFNQVDYIIKIEEINIDRNNDKKIAVTRYFKASDKSMVLIKELLNDSV